MASTVQVREKMEPFFSNSRLLGGTGRSVWHKSAPTAVRKAFAADECDPDAFDAGWDAWKAHLAERPAPRDPADVLPSKRGAIYWATSDSLRSRAEPAWSQRVKRLAKRSPAADRELERDVLQWLAEASGNQPQWQHAIEALACCHALPDLAAVVSADAWFALLDHLLVVADEAAGIELQAEPLVHQLLAGELPLTLAYLFPELAACRKLGGVAGRTLSAGLVDLLDGEGLLEAEHLSKLRPLLACWTRCWALDQEAKLKALTADAREQYEWLVRQAMQFTRYDGTHVLSNGLTGGWCVELFEAALEFGSDEDDQHIAALVLPGQSRERKREAADWELPDSVAHSEWAQLAVLRPEWSRGGERLTVLYHEQSMQVELSAGQDVLFSGTWELEVTVNGRPARPESDWEEVCWLSDEDVDLLELEIDLEGGIRVQRQMILARDDGCLLLGDIILGDQPAKLEYRGCLPLCPDIAFRAANESREGFLAGRARRALVLPLALPEWRADRRIGELKQTSRGLELRQSMAGQNLYAPLFIDLDRQRFTRQTTWRQLTVAESLEIQPPDVAAGYRVAIGDEQWLVYRSLAEKANRTLLGHNLSSEMLFAQFDETGEVESLAEID